ncbi:glycosyltransferase [Thiotrichales bacterium HSG1]|nr:glycosyltransferase [Thiotrichales bacterium HSG1]
MNTHWWKKSKLINKPTEAELRLWATSEWIEYQAWIFHHSFLTLHDWQRLHDEALSWPKLPLFTIVTPVFNINPDYLHECIYSVQTQAYPNWEMCLVDDGSDKVETKKYLKSVVKDPRLHLHTFPNNQGICRATNKAIAMANGDFIVFLDHDDRLATDALYWVAKTLQKHPTTDIIYSDRDELSPNGLRFMHLFKPDWSPETLFSGNYLFHMMVYRRTFLEQLQGVQIGKEGSQDYDLILRAAEKSPQVQHIHKVLYHWRQHEQSVSMEHNAKEYAYIAGLQALQDSLTRRGLKAKVSENKQLWRGHYQVTFESLSDDYQILQLNSLQNYAIQINQAFVNCDQSLVILGPNVEAINIESITELVSWLQIEDVGIVTGKIIDKQGNILHAGLVQQPTGIPMAVYAGFPEDTPGYMAATKIVRNVSSPHPSCCVLKHSLWQDLNGLDTDYIGSHALLDFALRSLNIGKRIVYNPFARFTAIDLQLDWPDEQYFAKQWHDWLERGDPYYNPYLTLKLNDMGLEV